MLSRKVNISSSFVQKWRNFVVAVMGGNVKWRETAFRCNIRIVFILSNKKSQIVLNLNDFQTWLKDSIGFIQSKSRC